MVFLRRCGISAVGNLAPRSLAHICAKDLRADIPWSENISSFCNRGVSADSRRIEFWRLEAWRIFTHFNPTLWFSAHHAPEIYVPEFRGPRFRPPKIYVPKIPSSILSPPLKYTYRYVQVKTDFRDLKNQNLKNGKLDLRNSNTLQISNSILYNFYFMQIYHIFTFEGLKLPKTMFWTILRQIKIFIMILKLSAQLFFQMIMIFHKRKVILH